MPVDLEQGPGILVKLIGGEQIRHTSCNVFDLSKKRYGVGFGALADDVGEHDLVSGIEGDPDPGVAQASFLPMKDHISSSWHSETMRLWSKELEILVA